MSNKKIKYSVIKPDTSSDSASAKSNGALFDSPIVQKLNIIYNNYQTYPLRWFEHPT